MRAKSRVRPSTRKLRSPFSALKGSNYIFVYGTLKKGGKFHRELAKDPGVRFAGEARIKGRLFELPNADYPGAVPTAENKYIYGQLFSVEHPEKTLRALDEFEGVGEGLFRRKMVEAWKGRRRTRAWAYFYAGSIRNANILASGTYA